MRFNNVEDFYPLAPAQQGMLFHAQAGATPVYVSQLAFTFTGRFDERRFESAWRQLIERHAVLRSYFVWEGLAEPVQVVCQHVELPIERHDWRSMQEVEGEFQSLLEADRKRGFDLRKAPALRIILVRLAGDRYRVLWTHHHILLDGWSVPILLDEFFALYGSDTDASAVALPARRPYRDYIAWLVGQDISRAKDYWHELLSGFDAPLAIGDHLPLSSNAPAGIWEHEACIEGPLAERIRQYCRRTRVTLNTVLLGAWTILLSRYTGQSDIVFGATLSGRSPDLLGSEDMVGMFVNTLPVRVRLHDTGTVAAMLRRIQEQQARTRQFEYSRLVDVQRWSGSRSGSSLFDTIVVFENYPSSGDSSPVRGADVADWSFHAQTNYALTLVAGVSSPDGRIMLRCVHDAERVASGSAARVLGHLIEVIGSLVERDDVLTGVVEAITADERRRVLHTWNEIAQAPCDGETIIERFAAQVAAQARSNAQRPALVSEHESLTYLELEQRSNQLACYLRTKGVGPEQIVAVCLDRGTSAIVTILAILKAGGAYLPLDSTNPRERLNRIVVESKASLVVTTRAYSHLSGSSDWPLIELDTVSEAIAAQSAHPVAVKITGSHLAYVIYTSGSTGSPKGVMVQHRSVVNLAQAQVRAFGITPESRTLQFAPLSFDASVSEIFCALLSGSTLHVVETGDLRHGDNLLRLLRGREISVVTLPPALLAVLPDCQLPHLATLVAAGDACDASSVARWAPGRRFINAYGPTETTVCATVSAPLNGADTVTIGAPLANARIYILDSDLRPVAPGLTGEIYVGGEVLARGYTHRPELTAERFLPDPFSYVPGCRMYRTRDLARHLPSGQIEYVGRRDSQVKVRGFRVELGEVESLLEKNPAVAKACVVARELDFNQKQLVAYIVPRAGAAPAPDTVLAALRAQLPDYSIPAVLVVLSSLPLTSSGKIDRAALPAPKGQDVAREEFVPPRNDAEARIAALWCEVLQLEAVDVHANFFELGGDSLLILRVQSDLRAAFGREISIAQMFSLPTIATLAKYLSDARVAQTGAFAAIQARANRSRPGARSEGAMK